MKLTYQAIYPKVKSAISRSKNGQIGVNQLKAIQKLGDSPLRYTTKGKRALRGYLEEEFAEQKLKLTIPDMDKLIDVRSVARLIAKKLGAI